MPFYTIEDFVLDVIQDGPFWKKLVCLPQRCGIRDDQNNTQQPTTATS